jgi:alpha-ketoglutaric semialdehyde dehydrogenase
MLNKFQPILIDGEWRPARNPVGSFRAVNPAEGTELADIYPISNFSDIEDALRAAHRDVAALAKARPEALADFLEHFAAGIESRAEELVETAHLETALPKETRLRSVELPRTTSQLRQAAAAARECSWCRATIDTKADIRSKFGPLGGPVAVFGPNNFPYAYNSAAGTDFAAAVAAGNPVIAKAHPCHPGTTRIFAEIAANNVARCGLPPAAFQMIYHMEPESGLKFVAHSLLGASTFTGSRLSGLRLKEAADRAGKPIYIETSSVNPIFVLPGALEERGEKIADEIFSSCTLGAGQFCTKPGLIVLLQGRTSQDFFESVRQSFEHTPAAVLVARSVLDGIRTGLEMMTNAGAEIVAGGHPVEAPGCRHENTLLRVSGDVFLNNPKDLQQEAFGPVSLCVFAHDPHQMLEIASALEGNLTGSIYSHSAGIDDEIYETIAAVLRFKVGRFLNDKVPTGVTVTASMVHGGPYPAAGHPGFTAVGFPAALLRFGALHGYDRVRHGRLPPELQDKNPTGRMWRLIDGEWTQRDV